MRAGFVERAGKGSHRKFVHSEKHLTVVLSGKLGDDAKPYQQREVAGKIREAES